MKWFVSFLVATLAFGLFVYLSYDLRWEWTGFPAEHNRAARSLWDWMDLLAVPLGVAGVAFFLNTWQSARDHKREDERADRERDAALEAERESALTAYLAQMADLLLERNLLHAGGAGDGENVRAYGRALTVAVLGRLNPERKGIVMRFLLETQLVRHGRPDLPLDVRGADLSHLPHNDGEFKYAELNEVNLTDAQLERVFMGGEAQFNGSNFGHANMRGARAPKAQFANADLRDADFRDADLSQARFWGAKLSGADLRGANVDGAEFADQGGVSSATYDERTLWPDGFDPSVAGATPG